MLESNKMTKKENQQAPTYLENLKSYFSQYCSASSIHGVQYLGENGRCVLEKLIWIIFITSVCYFCIFLIMKSYYKWITSPVIVTFGTREVPIHDIPFPAVTICPETKSDPNVFNFTKVAKDIVLHGRNISEEELINILSIGFVCPFIQDMLSDFYKFSSVNPLINLIQIFPDHRLNNRSSAKWLDENITMLSLSQTLTEVGLCYSFNMINYEDILYNAGEMAEEFSIQDTLIQNWTLEKGYPSPFSKNVYPRRSFMAGIDGGFNIQLYTNHSYIDYLCGHKPEGFRVTLHLPSDWPTMDKHFRLPLDQSLLVVIKPKLITISEQLKTYALEDRKCYLFKERQLQYFKHYSQQNCITECLTNYTISLCGCVPFYLPHNPDHTICNIGSYNCIKKSKVTFQLPTKDFNGVGSKSTECNCLPTCTSLEYDTEISQSSWNWRKIFQTIEILDRPIPEFDSENDHNSELTIYYKEMQFIHVERNELYGYVDFFSSTGGLLGLFIGISVTSLLEILYFLTLRLACNIHLYGKRFWSGDRDLVNVEVNK